MKKPDGPEIDMNLEGEFVEPPRPPLANRVMVGAAVVAILAGTLAISAFALWLALLILPIAVGASAVTYLIYRYQAWRGVKSVGGQQNLFRP
jgi:hypothetical protein